MVYIPNPQDVTRPSGLDSAGDMATELRAFKAYLQGLVLGGSNFYNIGGFRNRLRNSNFAVQTGGLSYSIRATDIPLVDKWRGISDAAGVNALFAGGPGNGGGPAGGDYYVALTGVVANATAQVYQNIAAVDCQDMVLGLPITISGMYLTDTLGNRPTISFKTPSTLIDTYTSTVTAAPSATLPLSNPLAAVWQSFSLTTTLTADASKGLQISFNWLTGMASQNHYLSRLQVETGSYATPYERTPFGFESSAIAFSGSKLLPTQNYGTGSNSTWSSNVSILFPAGQWTDSTNIYTINLTAVTKNVSAAWTSAAGVGGMGNGLTVVANTTYHAMAILFASGATSVYYDTSITAANAPTGTIAYRRIESFKTNGSSQIPQFVRVGDRVTLTTAVGDVNAATLGTTATLFSLSLPTGIPLVARIRAGIGTVGYITIFGPDETVTTAGTPTGNTSLNAPGTAGASGHFEILTNTSGQMKAIADSASRTFYVVTYGWIDRRGRDG